VFPQLDDAPVVPAVLFGVPLPMILSVVTAEGGLYVNPVVQVVPEAHDGMLTVTVAFVFELDGSAASTAGSEQLEAEQLAVVHDCPHADTAKKRPIAGVNHCGTEMLAHRFRGIRIIRNESYHAFCVTVTTRFR
jgi:hypothetical protein